jgi:hypothetical protein
MLWRIKMKKDTILYLLIIICFGCNQTNSSDEKKDTNLQNDSLNININLEATPEVKGDFTIYEHDLLMYNEKFFMSITPAVDSVKNVYETNILLTRKADTILNKNINIDSLSETILKHKIFEDSTEYSQIATEYELRKVIYHGVRTNDLYFEAEIASETRHKNLKVLFQISYAYKGEIGKLFVNGFNEKGFGPHKGEVENDKNRKISPP